MKKYIKLKLSILVLSIVLSFGWVIHWAWWTNCVSQWCEVDENWSCINCQTDTTSDDCSPPESCEGETTNEEEDCSDCKCGIKLNTSVPFIWNCIQIAREDTTNNDTNTTIVTKQNAFPVLMWALSKIVVTAILVFSFVLIIVAGVMMASSGGDSGRFSDGKKLIWKVIVWLALLWASWVILKLINPSFFW